MEFFDIDTESKEFHRWLILLSLNNSYPSSLSETTILRTLTHIPVTIGGIALRKELAYLESKGLLILSNKDHHPWLATIVFQGIDIIDYNVPAPVGISRPPKYWKTPGAN